ncbi:SpoIVB peptidase [Subdoligranulum variabile]|uniref:SpoIVB peptidase n=1 Tax=Subdoligranulum variabile TaxID=214851 RepID=UPI0026F27C42|nr:SpoIVB peptidase [Subdoligranulum variabile]
MPKHRVCRGLAAVLLCFLALVGGLVLALRAALPDTFYTAETELRIASMPWVTVQHKQESVAQAGNANEDKSRNVTLSLFGAIPLKTVRTVNVETRSVQVCGTPFGVKMFSDGALVVAFSDQYTNLGTENPAKEAGLKLGDLIVSAGGHAVRSNEELTQAITDAAGNAIPVVYQRDGVQHTTMLTPMQDASTGAYRAGLWVRDSSAGIGTMTFLDPLNGTFAGLGHAISDTDTGADITLLSGEIVPVVITGCVSGTTGSPGELRGEFSAAAAGTVLANDSTGVYGEYLAAMTGQSCPVMQPQEIALGDAEIWTTISGSTPRAYSVRIEQVNMTSSDPNRNLLVKVSDPELLAATGGIVRGMSGSPIVQNGRLVGAVTHVLVSDPTRGYGIFATTMLEKADSLP